MNYKTFNVKEKKKTIVHNDKTYKSVEMLDGNVIIDAFYDEKTYRFLVCSYTADGNSFSRYYTLEMLASMNLPQQSLLDRAIHVHTHSVGFIKGVSNFLSKGGTVESYKANTLSEGTWAPSTVQMLSGIFKGLEELVDHPERPGRKGTLSWTVMNLNDQYRWSRNKIADWIESLDIDTTLVEGEKNEDRNEE